MFSHATKLKFTTDRGGIFFASNLNLNQSLEISGQHVRTDNSGDDLRNGRIVNEAAVGSVQRGGDLSESPAEQKKAGVRIPVQHSVRNVRRAAYDRFGHDQSGDISWFSRFESARSKCDNSDSEKVRLFKGDESDCERPAAAVHRIQSS